MSIDRVGSRDLLFVIGFILGRKEGESINMLIVDLGLLISGRPLK